MNLFRKANANEANLEAAINKVLAEMQTKPSIDPEYLEMRKNLEALYALKAVDYADKPKGLSADTLFLVGGNLVGILVLVGYERAHVMTSKAFSLLVKTPVTR